MEHEPVRDTELHAFIDGELDRKTALRVAASVASSPALAREVARFRADKAILARLYGPIAHAPIPPRLLAPLAKRRANRRMVRRVMAASAVLAMLVVTWTGGTFLFPSPSERFVREALAARAGDSRPERRYSAASVVQPEQRDHLAETALTLPVKVPDLAAAGFHLLEMATYREDAGRHAVQLTYQDGKSRLFTVFLHPPVGSDRFALFRRGPLALCIWQNEELSIVMAGDLPPKEMLRVASLTYADLNL
jgi:anti-sigma factor RsiW